MARFFIDRPIFAWVLAIVVMLAGAFSITALPLEKYPDIAPVQVRISASYPGASAQTLEDSVTQVIEQKMKGLDGLYAMSSSSNSSGSASISLSFTAGTNADVAQMQVQNKLQQAMSQLPQAVQSQGVTVTKSGTDFLLVMAFYSADNSATNIQIGDYISAQLVDTISRIDGVGDVQTLGTQHAMRVWLDPVKLAAQSLMPSDVTAAITAQNAQVSAGQVGGLPAAPGQQLNLSTTARSKLQTVAQFREIALKTGADGSVVRLGDVARVELGGESYTVNTRYKGQPSAALGVYLAAGANAITVANAVKARVAELQPGFPYQLQAEMTYDTTPFVKISIQEVVKTLAEAMVLVVLIMYLFLQSWRATLIPAITVPVVLLGTFGVLAAADYSINSLTMFGMVLAIGLLVDDAIVVVENVERLMAEKGLSPREATRESMGEITGALVGIALVLAGVFIPMAFFGGATGVIYRQFSIAVVSAMVLSVLVALTLTPALTASLLQPLPPGATHAAHRGLLGRFFGGFNRGFDRGNAAVQTTAGALLRRGGRTMAVYALIVAAMAVMYQRLPTAFLPEEDQGVLMAEVRLPAGATNERLLTSLQQVENWLGQQADVAGYTMISGIGGDQATGRAFIVLKDWREREGPGQRAAEIARRANRELASLRDARVFVMQPPTVRGLGSATGWTVQLQDRGGLDHAGLLKARERFLELARKDPALANVRASGLDDAPQVGITIDDRRAGSLGVSTADINNTLATALGGSYVNDFLDAGRVKKVYVQGDAPYRMAPDSIGHWQVRNSSGAMVPFSAFASAGWTWGSPKLERYNGLGSFEIVGEAAAGVSSGAAMAAVEKLVAQLPPGVGLEWSGQSYQERLSGAQAPLLYAVSLLFVFLCMAALYESWSVPFSVMLVAPLGVIGAVAATALTGLHNDVYFQVGLLTTVGLAAKNAILIVEFAMQRQAQGIELVAATLEALRLRLRPILMTSLAFIFGVLPLALASGAGAGSRQAIGTGVLGGMLSATVLGVLFVPVFFVLVRGVFERRRARLAAAAAAAAVAVLSGCANLAPTYETPAAAVPAQLTASAPATGAASSLALPDGRAFVQDERLRQVIALALQNNRSLRQQVMAVEKARASYGIQEAALWPTVKATAAGSASRTPAEASSSGQAVTSRSASVNLGFAAYEIDLFGRVRNLGEAALETTLASEQTRRSAQISLLASVAQAWLALAADEAQLALSQQTLASQQQSLDKVRQRQQLGADSALTLAQSQTLVEGARRDVAAAQAQVQQDRNALALLVGAALPAHLAPTAEDAQRSATALLAVPAGLSSAVLLARPDVQAAEHTLKAANVNIGAARAARYPSLSLTSTVGTASKALGDLFQGGAWSFAPSLSLPLFDGGASAANVRAAEISRDIQIAAYDQAVQTAFREVADALAVRESLTERLAAQRALVAAAGRSAELAQARWQGGAASFLDVLDAQRTHYAAQQTLVNLQLTEQSNRVTLFKVLGGAWTDTDLNKEDSTS